MEENISKYRNGQVSLNYNSDKSEESVIKKKSLRISLIEQKKGNKL